MRFLALILALYGAFYLGTNKASPHRLEGTLWCFYGEYSSLETYDSAVGVPAALIDVTKRGVTVYSKCK